MRKQDGLRTFEGFATCMFDSHDHDLSPSWNFDWPMRPTSMAEDDDWLHNEHWELPVQDSPDFVRVQFLGCKFCVLGRQSAKELKS